MNILKLYTDRAGIGVWRTGGTFWAWPEKTDSKSEAIQVPEEDTVYNKHDYDYEIVKLERVKYIEEETEE